MFFENYFSLDFSNELLENDFKNTGNIILILETRANIMANGFCSNEQKLSENIALSMLIKSLYGHNKLLWVVFFSWDLSTSSDSPENTAVSWAECLFPYHFMTHIPTFLVPVIICTGSFFSAFASSAVFVSTALSAITVSVVHPYFVLFCNYFLPIPVLLSCSIFFRRPISEVFPYLLLRIFTQYFWCSLLTSFLILLPPRLFDGVDRLFHRYNK